MNKSFNYQSLIHAITVFASLFSFIGLVISPVFVMYFLLTGAYLPALVWMIATMFYGYINASLGVN